MAMGLQQQVLIPTQHPLGHHSWHTHSSRIRRSVRAAPPHPGFPAPTHPGTGSGAPIQGIPKFPSAELAALLLSQAEDPSAANHRLATLQHALQAARHQKGSPILKSPPS